MSKARRRSVYFTGPAGLRLLRPGAITRDRPPTKFLVEGLIRAGSVVLLAGRGGGGKSWLALDLVVAVDTGTPWLGRFAVNRGRALYLDWESGEGELSRRASQLLWGRKLERFDDLHLSPMTELSASEPDFENTILKVASNYDVVVIDSLRAAAPDFDENASDIRIVIDCLRRVAEKSGCTVLIIHHGRKGNRSGADNAAESVRGSTAIVDAVDAAYVVQDLDDMMRIRPAKVRFGKAPPAFVVKIDDAPARVAGRLRASTTLDVADARGAREKEIADAIISALTTHDGLSARALRKQAKSKGTDVDAVRDMLLESGKIVRKGSPGRPTWHLPRRKKSRRTEGD